MPPNPRLQRTRSASPPSPLSRQPLGTALGVWLLVVTGGLGVTSPAAQCADTLTSGPAVQLPQSGTYTLTLTALGGSRKGASVRGRLELSAVPTGSRSDTGALYGTLAVNPKLVGAPLCEDAPPLSSPDPKRPGVLMTRSTDGALTLWIASVANQDTPGMVSTDGCGVALQIDESSVSGFRGRWGSAGIVHDGCGTFRAVKVFTSWPNPRLQRTRATRSPLSRQPLGAPKSFES